MVREHTVDELRSVLKDLRTAIDALEAALITDKRQRSKAAKRLEEVKMQEAVILAKLGPVDVRPHQSASDQESKLA
jgi:hypothetical protein